MVKRKVEEARESDEPGVLSLALILAICVAFLLAVGVANEAFTASAICLEPTVGLDAVEDPATSLMEHVRMDWEVQR